MVAQKKKKVLILITHSLGEIDIILPLFVGVKAKHNVKIELIFAVKKIYKQFKSSNFYRFCASELDMKVTYCRLPNKFDLGFRKLMFHPIGNKLLKVYFILLEIIKFPLLIPKLVTADVYMHEYSNQLKSTWFLYYANKFLSKNIFVYHHGHCIDMDKVVTKKKVYSDRSIALVFNKHSSRYFNDLGYKNQYIIGYPKFYKEWKKIVNTFTGTEFEGEKYVMIFSRHIHQYYMDEDKYKWLLLTACRVIREKLNDIKIIIKPHPREDTTLINRILSEACISNAKITHENSMLCSRDALFVITFWGGVILDALALNIPAVEFYVEANRFREAEPEGSAYKKLGIHTADNEQDLKFFIDSVLLGQYNQPKVAKELSSLKDISFLLA